MFAADFANTNCVSVMDGHLVLLSDRLSRAPLCLMSDILLVDPIEFSKKNAFKCRSILKKLGPDALFVAVPQTTEIGGACVITRFGLSVP